MGRWRQRLSIALTLALPVLAPAAQAAEATLVYREANRWVAPADNAPLKLLMKQAQAGKVFYTVKLPARARTLAVARLAIVRDLLAREANKAVVIAEVSGSAKPQTLVIGY